MITFTRGRPKKYKTEEERKLALKNYYKTDRVKKRLKLHVKKYQRKVRLAVIEHYGGSCDCCNEDKIEFLCIDHVNGNGARHIRLIKSPIYSWLKKNNYPKEGFRVLCHNCNMSLGFYGYCPHKGKQEQFRKEYNRKSVY